MEKLELLRELYPWSHYSINFTLASVILGQSKELKEILKNPHLRVMLENIDKSDKPDEIMQKAMLEPLFVEFADECLKVVEPRQPQDET